MTRDELKALWAELGENHLNHRIGDYATDIPPGPPRPGPDECDWKAPRVYAMFETHIRGEKKVLLGNLRAFPPRGTISEVWNQGIYKYIAEYKAIPNRGPRGVNIKLELHTNSGSMLNGQDDKDRVIYYEYNLVYGLDGRVDETNPAAADWISVGGEALFAPLNILELVESRWQGHNPYVTEANVRALDLANGGGLGQFASAPPRFRSVQEYEGNRSGPARATMFASGNSGSSSAGVSSGGSSVVEPDACPPFDRCSRTLIATPFATRNEPRDATCFANSGLKPTNYKQVWARAFPPASPPGAD